MKKIQMGLMAVVALTGFSSAFAFNHHPRTRAGVTYYARQVAPGQAKWTATQPDGDCSADSQLDCTITSTSANVTSLPVNTYPAQFTKIGTDHKAYN